MARLRSIGALSLPLPVRSADRADAVADVMVTVLALVGEENLPVGPIYEAHVNALYLIARYRIDAQ